MANLTVIPKPGDIVTGFFPETKPKHNWQTNPRPLLVLRRYTATDGSISVLLSYGTGEISKVKQHALVIANLSTLNSLNLAKPTAFILMPGRNLAILPWTDAHFAPWTGFKTPIIAHLPHPMKVYVHGILQNVPDIPTP